MNTDANALSLEDVIYICNIFERVEDLEGELAELGEAEADQEAVSDAYHDAYCEHLDLIGILDDLKGNGGGEQWRGNWYPSTLIRESHFKDYAQELAEDIGAIDPKATWSMTCIDWDQAAQELRYDYTSTEIDGITYYYR